MAQAARAREIDPVPDEEALVALHLPLVRQVAQQMAAMLPASIEIDEIVSWGAGGLLDALRRYQEGEAASFRTYARIRIRGAILDELRVLDWVSRTGRERASRIADGRRCLEHRLGRSATQEEVAGELGVDLRELQRWVGELGDLVMVPMDELAEIAVRREGEPGERDGEDPESASSRRARARDLRSAIERLPGKEREVVPLYYAGELTMKEVGARLGVTESRVCQLHGQAIGRLREMLSAWAPEGSASH